MCNGIIFYLGVSSTWDYLLSNHKIEEKKQNPRTRDELVIYGCKMPRDTIDLALASARALYNEITVPCLHLKLALWISISFTYIKQKAYVTYNIYRVQYLHFTSFSVPGETNHLYCNYMAFQEF